MLIQTDIGWKIFCDRCGRELQEQEEPSPKSAFDKASKRGWVCVAGFELCKPCDRKTATEIKQEFLESI